MVISVILVKCIVSTQLTHHSHFHCQQGHHVASVVSFLLNLLMQYLNVPSYSLYYYILYTLYLVSDNILCPAIRNREHWPAVPDRWPSQGQDYIKCQTYTDWKFCFILWHLFHLNFSRSAWTRTGNWNRFTHHPTPTTTQHPPPPNNHPLQSFYMKMRSDVSQLAYVNFPNIKRQDTKFLTLSFF